MSGSIPEALLPSCPNSGGNPLHQCAACTEHDKVCKTISILENVLAYVLSQELEVRSRLNSSHGRLHNLPPEITSLIFEAAIEEGILPLFLGSICKMWRNLVWTTPSLWTDIDFILNPGSPNKLPESIHTLARRIELVDQSILRSCAMPLSITIFKNLQNECVIPPQCLWPLLLILRRNRSRLSTLSLQLPPELFRSLSDITAPNLHTLTLQTTDPYGFFPQHHIINLKSLTEHVQTLAIRFIDLNHIQMSYKSLLHVELERCTPSACITLVQQATEPQSCVLHVYSSQHLSIPSPQLTVKKHLRKLSLLCAGGGINLPANFFPLFSVPALEELILPEGNESIDYEPLRAMLERSRCPLTTLQLPQDAWTIENLRELLSLVPTLVSLTLLNTLRRNSMSDVMTTVFPHPPPPSHPKIDEFVLSTRWTVEDSLLGWKFLPQMFPLSEPEAGPDGAGDSHTTPRHYPTKLKISTKINKINNAVLEAVGVGGVDFRLDDDTASHIDSLRLRGCQITLDGQFVDGELGQVYRLI